jgi:hypothetical protein
MWIEGAAVFGGDERPRSGGREALGRLTKKVGNPLCRPTVPQGNGFCHLSLTGCDLQYLCPQEVNIPPQQLIGAQLNGHRTLRILTHSQTRHVQKSALFLNAPGVRDHHRRSSLQSEKLEVRLRIRDKESFVGKREI